MLRILAVLTAGALALALLASAEARETPVFGDERPAPAPQQDTMTIIETAEADGRFTTLLAAIDAAGLTETLNGPGPFTVFAPTDEAFAALPAGTVDALLEDTAALRQVLLYHVVEGEVPASEVVALDSATTVQGEPLPIEVSDSQVRVGDANVVATDVMASNGIIHVIDSVLIPPSQAAPAPSPAPSGNAGLTGGGATVWLAALLLAGAVALPLAGRTAVGRVRTRDR